jgi:phasin family protein
MTRYSQRSLDDVMQAWRQLLSSRSFGDIVDIQTRYAQKAYDTHTSEMSKLAELYREIMSNSAKPIERSVQASRRSNDVSLCCTSFKPTLAGAISWGKYTGEALYREHHPLLRGIINVMLPGYEPRGGSAILGKQVGKLPNSL